MIYYLTGPTSAHTRGVLVSIYEETVGETLPFDENGVKVVPQNDGAIQCNHEFESWPLVGGGLKPGAHCVIDLYSRPENPDGILGPVHLALLASMGIEVLREDQIPAAQLALLPKFQ